jgi:hypothetical protein
MGVRNVLLILYHIRRTVGRSYFLTFFGGWSNNMFYVGEQTVTADFKYEVATAFQLEVGKVLPYSILYSRFLPSFQNKAYISSL